MKHKSFSIFITVLGFITAYISYLTFHSDELSSVSGAVKIEEEIFEDLVNRKIFPKTNYLSPMNIPLDSPKEVEKPKKVFFKTEKKVAEEETQEVYGSLMLEDHSELMEEKNMVFEALDKRVRRLNEHLTRLDVLDEHFEEEMVERFENE